MRAATGVWILGRWPESPERSWEIQGVFASRFEAQAAARPGEFFGFVMWGRAPTETTHMSWFGPDGWEIR